MSDLRDEFLSDEDLDLQNLTDEELVTYWNLWLQQAQITNDDDQATYSHGVFDRDPGAPAGRRPYNLARVSAARQAGTPQAATETQTSSTTTELRAPCLAPD